MRMIWTCRMLRGWSSRPSSAVSATRSTCSAGWEGAARGREATTPPPRRSASSPCSPTIRHVSIAIRRGTSCSNSLQQVRRTRCRWWRIVTALNSSPWRSSCSRRLRAGFHRRHCRRPRVRGFGDCTNARIACAPRSSASPSSRRPWRSSRRSLAGGVGHVRGGPAGSPRRASPTYRCARRRRCGAVYCRPRLGARSGRLACDDPCRRDLLPPTSRPARTPASPRTPFPRARGSDRSRPGARQTVRC